MHNYKIGTLLKLKDEDHLYIVVMSNDSENIDIVFISNNLNSALKTHYQEYEGEVFTVSKEWLDENAEENTLVNISSISVLANSENNFLFNIPTFNSIYSLYSYIKMNIIGPYYFKFNDKYKKIFMYNEMNDNLVMEFDKDNVEDLKEFGYVFNWKSRNLLDKKEFFFLMAYNDFEYIKESNSLKVFKNDISRYSLENLFLFLKDGEKGYVQDLIDNSELRERL